MSPISFQKILSCSSEDRVHRAENLLQPDQHKKWLSSKSTEEEIECIVEFATASSISSLEIGNDGSAFVELFVARSSSDDWTLLLPVTIFMTPSQSRSNKNRTEVKSFKSFELKQASLNQRWQRLKIVCQQKFNRSKQFGLSFIKLNPTDNHENPMDSLNKSLNGIEDEDETDQEQQKIGSFFAKKQAEKKSSITAEPDTENDRSQLMKKIVFVLSGFQNPSRSELRDKATSMGAIYSEDWNKKCTHLICAFANTPKFAQVQQSGKGSIVTKQWILDCYEQNQFLPETSYELKETTNSETPKRTSKKKKKEEEAETTDPQETEKKTPVKRKSALAKEEELKKLKAGDLPDFFHEKHFYVSYGDYDDITLLDIVRVILAYDGILERQINTDVKYVITNRMWNQDFEKISKANPEINFINLDWLQDCHDANQFVPLQPYLIVP